jgi:ligand-binding sensor domain-containing protein
MSTLQIQSKLIIVIFLFVSFSYSQQVKQTNNPNQIPAVLSNCIIQDSFGFIWFGDQEGLVRYDGYHTKRYKTIPFDTTSITSNYVTDIEEDSRGNLWIATYGGGLNYFEQKTEKFTHYLHNPQAPTSLGSDNQTKIIVNKDGSLWIATIGNDFTYVSWDSAGPPKFRQYNEQDLSPDVPTYSIMDMYKDTNGILWIGSAGFGLQRLDTVTGEIKSVMHNPKDPNSISNS